MPKKKTDILTQTRKAALDVLLHNAHGPFHKLPRTAGWGYPEPYTRDLMLSALGFLASGHKKLGSILRRTLVTLAKNQSPRGHITSLVHDAEDRGASDCTPLFLFGLGLYRRVTGESDFLSEAAEKALTWMYYQSPSDRILVAQQPTSDWRDEQWVLGYGLFVNTVWYAALRLFDRHEDAERLRQEMRHFTVTEKKQHRHVHEGLAVKHKPYYALWSYKVYSSERFDLLGNSLAILTGIASPTRARSLVHWIESECEAMQQRDQLGVDLPPNFFPYIQPENPDWLPRYKTYNLAGEYHNGGVWPFICGIYVAALVAAGRLTLARQKLETLARLNHLVRAADVEFGFNEWIKAQNGEPMGQDWQTWSAALYLYADACVQQERALYFEDWIHVEEVK